MRQIEIDKKEVLRYLGYKNQDLEENMDNLINESIGEIKSLMEEKYVYKVFDLIKEDEILVEGTNLKLIGKDIKRHLENSDSLIIMAFTLGHRVDKILRYYEKISMSKALILDACASTAIEAVADKINKDLEESYIKENKSLTWRFSPGYGDLPIDIQGQILDILDGKKSIGLTATSHNILIPRKSVTAFIGISDMEYKGIKPVCKNCSKYKDCNFRRGGKTCGN